jgi:ubiquitin-activating enzyme E1-like protein 2
MSAAQEIDDSLYSRQRYVLGDQAMKAMAASNVFLSGLGGLGIEIGLYFKKFSSSFHFSKKSSSAKNIALAGIRSLTIHDEVNATLADLGTQFYLSEKTINQNRAAASLDQLTSLNPYVKIQVSTEKLDNIDLEYFSQFKCVILTESKLETQLRINKYCHEHKIGFITADVRGVFCWSFVDFAPGFVVTDSNGERPSEIMVAHISNAEQAVISCLEHHFHNLETGDVVQFSDLTGQGYQSLNGNQYRITVIDPYNFSIEVDSREFPPFERGKALAVQVKIPLIIDFLSLEESLKQPELLFPDLGKFDNPWKSFLAIRALYSFQESQGKLPGVWNKSDAEQLVDLAKKFQSAHELSDDMLSPNLISALSFTAQGSLSCFTSFLGGTVAQEVLKALSGKFLPIKQWLILDALEILPSNAFDQDFNPSEFLPKNDRYDQLRICVGESVCSKLRQTKLFMVGAGAIGCEMMKNYALLGVSTKQDQGVIHLTDNDLIEKSNLNRQFLFRPNNIQVNRILLLVQNFL